MGRHGLAPPDLGWASRVILRLCVLGVSPETVKPLPDQVGECTKCLVSGGDELVLPVGSRDRRNVYLKHVEGYSHTAMKSNNIVRAKRFVAMEGCIPHADKFKKICHLKIFLKKQLALGLRSQT